MPHSSTPGNPPAMTEPISVFANVKTATLVSRFLATRDKRRELAVQEAELKVDQEVLAQEIIARMNAEEQDAFKDRTTQHTCYRYTRWSARVTDKSEFETFILSDDPDAWGCLQIGASDAGVEIWRTQHATTDPETNEVVFPDPPGAAYVGIQKLGVRKS